MKGFGLNFQKANLKSVCKGKRESAQTGIVMLNDRLMQSMHLETENTGRKPSVLKAFVEMCARRSNTQPYKKLTEVT